jgi:hypothetical protein
MVFFLNLHLHNVFSQRAPSDTDNVHSPRHSHPTRKHARAGIQKKNETKKFVIFKNKYTNGPLKSICGVQCLVQIRHIHLL